MRRRTRSPKGARGASTAGTRGGRGRGRARGGAKGKTGRGGNIGGKTSNSISGSSSRVTSDSVNIIAKDNHLHNNNVTSSHFSRTPNGLASFARGEHVLQLGGVPRRPFMGPAQQNGNAVHNNNNNVNHVGNDFYLHKKFKKVTATVDAAPSSSSSGSGSSASNSGSKSTEASGSSSSSAPSTSSSSSGMVYKPKFRIKSDIETVEAAQEPPQPKPLSLVSPREKTSPIPATPAPDVLEPVVKSVVSGSAITDVRSGSSGSGNASVILISSRQPMSPSAVSPLPSSSSAISESQSVHAAMYGEPGRISRDARLDRKSLDDRISKIIDENQSILEFEWPEQFTKMLKNHTSRGQSSLQRTSHLLSGGSTTELPSSPALTSSNILAHSHHHNGLLRQSSTSSVDMPTSGGSVELLPTSPHHHNSLLNSNGMVHTNGRSAAEIAFKHGAAAEMHHFPLSIAGGASSSSVTGPTDLSYGALSGNNNNGGAVITTNTGCPSPASSTGSTSSSTTSSSSMVPKKRRRLSPTPSRLCGGEVSELPVNEASGGKNYFQDVDMTVRVSNCGPSGAKVTIRTNNGTISGGSVQTAAAIGAPVDFTKMIDTVPSPLPLVKPQNGTIFFPGPGPSSNNTLLSQQVKPLSLVSNKASGENSPSAIPGQKPPKSPRGRPPRKKSVPEATIVSSDCATSRASSLGSSLLGLDATCPPPEIPSRQTSEDTPSTPKLLPSTTSVASIPTSTTITLLSVSPGMKLPEAMKSSIAEPEVTSNSDNGATAKEKSSSPTGTSENANPDKETPFRVVPTPTQNPKRPTFLALKPVNTNSKKTDPGVLPSPETPRVAKPYNQMTINGQAYTYLGFKVSTRSSYTCLFKTQPMFVPQETDAKLSMYTNWQPRPRDPNHLETGISTNDSRVNGRKSPHHILYTTAAGTSCDTLAVSSPDNQPPICSPICESKTFLSSLQNKSLISSAEVSEPGSSFGVGSSSSPMPSSSSQIPYSQPIKVVVSPPPSSSGVVPISPPSNPASPITFVAASNPAVGSGGLMSIASLSPKLTSVASMAARDAKSRRTRTPPSSSDTNSVDESHIVSVRRRSLPKGFEDDGESNTSDGPLALTNSRDDSAGSRYDSQRVKIMEGGFESNEDYTYVRGRGRGRYVCEACGIRCKKPSMLRKHLKTHTDLRPYTCKLCNFSFKTKGNLTKHQKSKSHHKKCAGLGIHPESSTSLAMSGPIFSISDTNTTDDNESDDDYDDNGDPETDSQDEGEDSEDEVDSGSKSFEKEIAQSLLDLSKATVRLPSQGSASSDYESSNDVRLKINRSVYPFGSCVVEDISNSSVGSCTNADSNPAPEIPIDLSVKPITTMTMPVPRLQSPPISSESESKRIKLEKNGLIRAVGVVREAEAWEPAEDEGSRCLNLKKVLNNPENGCNTDLPQLRIPEVKTEVVEFPANNSAEPRSLIGPRQRTESETSSCSTSGSLINTLPTIPPVTTEVAIERSKNPVNTANTSQQAGISSLISAVKLHQPWLSPSSPKDKKDPVEVPQVEIKPVSLSPEAPKSSKPVDDNVEIVPGMVVNVGVPTTSTTGPPSSLADSGLDGVSSPNSKLFSGLSGIKPRAEFRQPSGAQALVKDEGKAECNVCGKTFARASQLTLHMNIHYIERPFRCDPCGVSFRTKGHLIKHRRSSSHDCKVYLTEAWGVANEENPRPFKCPDCKIAFRIHGHLAKHLRSKMHIMRMECLGKLPFGIYFEMEKSGINLNEIDTTDCDMSLVSLQSVARKIYGDQWKERLTAPVEEPPA